MSTEIETLAIDTHARRAGRRVSPALVGSVVVALLLLAYGHWRFGAVDDRVDRLHKQVIELRAANDRLGGQITTLATRVEQSDALIQKEIKSLREIPPQLAELGQSVAELRSRTDAPQRTWVRAEALYLLELAERRLRLEHDVPTAVAAMESADARLATVADPAVGEVRRQLELELAALRTVRVPDLPRVIARITTLEQQASTWPVLGVPVGSARRAPSAELPGGVLQQAWHRMAQALRDLVSLRRVEPSTVRLVTGEEESLRRQHLDLLLFAARLGAMQQDAGAFSQSLRSADAWLAQYFDPTSPGVRAARVEIGELSSIDVEPPVPEIGAAAQILQRVIRGGTTRGS
ncbi:MAG TPA: uroporphyrinogen-III C-methyltransferase [Steroidobacteraceae bacterium]|nr:uroporphyrinogen-III C-methyltransferase [Steroidobacteraceae bacterium]